MSEKDPSPRAPPLQSPVAPAGAPTGGGEGEQEARRASEGGEGRWSRVAALLRDRLVFGWVAGAGFWLSWLVSLALGGWRHDATGHRVGADHVQYYVVGRLVAEGYAARIYDAATMAERQKEVGGEKWKGFLPFRYPPFYAPCFTPTSRLSYEASFLVWALVGLGCLAASGWLLGVGWRDWLVSSLCFYPVFATVSYGQNSLVSLLLISAAAALWLRDRPFLAGLAAGLLAFKPPLAVGIGVLWLLDVRRSWRSLLGMAVTIQLFAAVAWLGMPDASRAFVESLGGNVTMQEQDRSALAPLYSSQGFWQLLLTKHLDFASNPLALLTSVAGLAVFVLLWLRWRDRRAAVFGLAALMTPWLSPYMMVYDWAILLVPAVLLRDEVGRDRWLCLAALLWAAAFLSGPLVRGQLLASPAALQVGLPALGFAALALLAKPQAERRRTGAVDASPR